MDSPGMASRLLRSGIGWRSWAISEGHTPRVVEQRTTTTIRRAYALQVRIDAPRDDVGFQKDGTLVSQNLSPELFTATAMATRFIPSHSTRYE